MSLIAQIENYARQRPFEWVNGGEFERLGMLVWTDEDGRHYKASNVSRRCRELAEIKPDKPPVLERKEMDGSVWYRYIKIMDRIARKETEPTPSESREESKQIALI